jgi:hypothetical protein
MLLGSKVDLESRVVTFEEARELAEYEGVAYMDISSKTGKNTEEAFLLMVTNAKERFDLHCWHINS